MRALAGELDGLMNPSASTSLITWLLIPMYLGSPEAKSRENAKLAYSKGMGRPLLCPLGTQYDWAHFLIDNTSITFSSSTTTTNKLIVINSKSWCNGWSSCFQYCGERSCYFAEALDEMLVKICKVENLLRAHCCIGWPSFTRLCYQVHCLLVTSLPYVD